MVNTAGYYEWMLGKRGFRVKDDTEVLAPSNSVEIDLFTEMHLF